MINSLENGYLIDLTLEEFYPIQVKDKVDAIQKKAQDYADETNSRNAEIAGRAVAILLEGNSDDSVRISREQILARLKYLAEMLSSGPVPSSMAVTDDSIDIGSGIQPSMDIDEGMNLVECV